MSEPLSLEDLYETRSPMNVTVSPDGDYVAFTVSESDPNEDEYRNSLFLAPTDGSHDPHRLTRVANANSPKWGPNGDQLAFLASREQDVVLAVGEDTDSKGSRDDHTEDADKPADDDEPKPQVWVFNLSLGGDARQATEFDEGVRGFDWSPDGDRFVISARDPTEEQQEYLDGIRDEKHPYEVTRIQHKQDGAGFTDAQGGINTLYVVTRDTRFAAAATEHGVYDFYSGVGTTDMHQRYINDLGVPWENEDAYRQMSSIRDIDQIETPLLITAGEDDCRTPPSQAEQLYVSAKRAGIESKLIIYQDEHHGISRPDRTHYRLKSLTEWFETHDPGNEESKDPL